jgi:hypothetical protein
MFAAVVKLAGRSDRKSNERAVLIPGGKIGVWIAASCGFIVVLGSIVLSLFPPGDEPNKMLFEIKLVGGTLASVLIGLILYWRGAREKARETVAGV